MKRKTATPIPPLNKANFQAVIDKIEANPSCWKQDSWHCCTSHCFGGLSQILSGKPANDDTVRRDARQWLGLTKYEADYLFDCDRKLHDFKSYCRAGYDRAGYDRAGYDRAGYDRAGYDRDGLNERNESR